MNQNVTPAGIKETEKEEKIAGIKPRVFAFIYFETNEVAELLSGLFLLQ